MGPDEESGELVCAMERLVDDVYKFRDHYFENHPIEDALHKGRKVREKQGEALAALAQLEEKATLVDRALYLYLRGKLLNVDSEFSKEAESLLSRAVKLNPRMVEAWNELGESYTRKPDFVNSRICFEGALEHKKNKVSLRSLSMVLRQLSTSTPQEKVSNIDDSLAKGREAVALDTKDGMSWSILGNAFFSHFFMVSQNPKTLKQAMSAYSQAEKDVVSRSTPELHYNKGIALKYEEMFECALKSFAKAQVLDPTWEGPKKQEENLIKYLDSITTLIQLKGKLKPKKLSSMLESLEPKNLGVYGGGSYISPGGVAVKLNHISFKELAAGLNSEVVVLGRVICSVFSEESVPFTFVVMDAAGAALVVTLYNLSPGRGVIIGDSVAIAEPYLTEIDFTHQDQEYKFGVVRVESPLVLVINGKKASKDLQAGVQMTTFTKS